MRVGKTNSFLVLTLRQTGYHRLHLVRGKDTALPGMKQETEHKIWLLIMSCKIHPASDKL